MYSNAEEKADKYMKDTQSGRIEKKAEPIKEVCEWSSSIKWVSKTSCGRDNSIGLHAAKNFTVCPYCTKPINIKE